LSDTPPIPENQTAAYKAAKLAVIILSTLIILALIALVVGGISKISGKSSGTAGVSSAAFQLPPDGEIVEMQTQPGRLILRVRSKGAEEIDIIDTQDGRLVSQIKARVDVPR
jgi:hypothetical protein